MFSVLGKRPVATSKCEPSTMISDPRREACSRTPRPDSPSTRPGLVFADSDDDFILEELRQRFGNIRILTVDQAIIPFHDSDAATQTAHGLGKFQRNIAAAKNQQMFRNDVELQRLHMSERRSLCQAGQVRDLRPSAGVDEDLVAMENALPPPDSETFRVLSAMKHPSPITISALLRAKLPVDLITPPTIFRLRARTPGMETVHLSANIPNSSPLWKYGDLAP